MNCVCVCLSPEELRQLLTHNELQIRAIQTLWEQHLQEALKDWEQQYANITQVVTGGTPSGMHTREALRCATACRLCLHQERRMMQMYPYILNINEDAQLSGMVKLFVQEGAHVCLSVAIGKKKKTLSQSQRSQGVGYFCKDHQQRLDRTIRPL